MHPITVTVHVPDSVLADILTTAVEGGSSYWLAAERIERDADLNVTRIVSAVDASTFHQFDADINRHDITQATILAGLALLAEGALPGRNDLRAQIAAMASDSHDIDAGDADAILQLGFFGKVVFG